MTRKNQIPQPNRKASVRLLKVSYWIVLASVVLVGPACDKPTNGITAPEEPPPSTPSVVVLDSVQTRLVSDSATLAAGNFRFVGDSADNSISVGDIIIGPQGGGFLRRASSVVKQGDTLVVGTTAASLQEALSESGSFNMNVPMRIDTGEPVASGLVALRNVQWGEPLRVSGVPGVTKRTGGLDMANVELVSSDSASISLSGKVEFDPDLNVGAKFEQDGFLFFPKLKEFHAKASGTLKLNADVAAFASKTYKVDASQVLFAYKRKFAGDVGGVPVYGEARFKFKAKFHGQLGITGSASAGIQNSLYAGVEVRYENSTWHKDFLGDVNASHTGPTVSAQAELNLVVGVEPEIEIEFYSALTTTLTPFPYLGYTRNVNLLNDCVHDYLFAGLKADVSGDVTIFDHVVAKLSPIEILDKADTLYRHKSPECSTPLTGTLLWTQATSGVAIDKINADGTGYSTVTTVPVTSELCGNRSGGNCSEAPMRNTSWSPDGKKIAFLKFVPNTTLLEIYVMNADGTGETRVTTNDFDENDVKWSPDGSKIAFERAVDYNFSNSEGIWFGTTSAIFVVNIDGTGLTQVTPLANPDGPQGNNFIAEKPSWSPDGHSLVFEENATYLWRVDVDGTNLRHLTDKGPPYCCDEDEYPVWSPDGSKILFSHHASGSEDPLSHSLWVMNAADGSGRTPLISDDDKWNPLWSTWSPDGNRIAFIQWRGTTDYPVGIYIADSDGTNIHYVPVPNEDYYHAAGLDWSPRKP